MHIEKRKTKEGTVFDVRYHVSGKGSEKKSKTFNRKSDANNFIVEKQKEFQDRRLGFISTPLLEEATFKVEAAHWLDYGKIKFSASHYKRVKDILEKDLLPKYSSWSIDRFNLDLVSTIQVERKKINRRKPDQEASNATVNRVTEVLCAVLNHSAKKKRIPFNPVQGYEKLPDDAQEMSFWEPEEACDFLTYVDSHYPLGHKDRWVYVSLLTALNTGVRGGELWGLQPIDLVKMRPLIHIKRQWSPVTKSFEMLKGKRNRKNKQDLPYRHVARNEKLFFELNEVISCRNVKPSQVIFYGEGGQPRNHDGFVDRFRRLVKSWGGRPIRFHDLRHTAITLWVHHGVNVKVVQQMAGHESLTTTMKYVHMVGGSVEQVSEQFFVGTHVA